MIRNIPLFKVFMASEVVEEVGAVLLSGYIGQGPQVERFEQQIVADLGVPYVVTVNSGTSGLHLALHLLRRAPNAPPAPGDAEDGDEIISTPVTCTATNWAILANRFNIRWADVDPTTGNISPEDVCRKLSPRTRAIIAVHWGGYPCDFNGLKKAQRECYDRYGFYPPIICDNAHAWGSEYDHQSVGAQGDINVYSFQAIKTLTTGDGGCLTLPNDRWFERARVLRWYGLDRNSSKDFRCEQDIAEWGYKFHMNDIAATIGLANLPYMNGLIAKQRETAAFYDTALRDVPGLTLLDSSFPERVAAGTRSSYWLYTVRAERREDLMQKLRSAGVGVSRVHDRNDKHSCVADYQEPAGSLPGTDRFCSEMFCIPCGWWVTAEEREFVAETIRNGW